MAAGCLILEGPQDKNEHNIFISVTNAERLEGISKEVLAKVWQISEDEARITLEVTSKLNHHDPDSGVYRKFGTNDHMLQYKRTITYFFFDTFQVTNIALSIHGFTYMQPFVSYKDILKVYEMRSEKQFLQEIKLLCKDVEVST